jgi:hypothetical protein
MPQTQRRLNEAEVEELAQKTVREFREAVRDLDLSIGDIAALAEAEGRGKDRKTIHKFLNHEKTELQKDRNGHDRTETLSGSDSGHDLSLERLEKRLVQGEEAGTTVEELERKIVRHEETERERLIENLAVKGLPESQLEQSTTEDLRKLMDAEHGKRRQRLADNLEENRTRRQELIERLKQEGISETKLQDADVKDLEQLWRREKRKKMPDKSEGEMMEEVKRDLSRLLSSVRNAKERDDEDGGISEKIKSLRASMDRAFGRREDVDIHRHNMEQKLESYRHLPEYEAAVKTAYLMKGYLEFGMEVDEEMSYKELAMELPHQDDGHVERVVDFFMHIHTDRYKHMVGELDIERVIDSCQYVVEHLSFD